MANEYLTTATNRTFIVFLVHVVYIPCFDLWWSCIFFLVHWCNLLTYLFIVYVISCLFIHLCIYLFTYLFIYLLFIYLFIYYSFILYFFFVLNNLFICLSIYSLCNLLWCFLGCQLELHVRDRGPFIQYICTCRQLQSDVFIILVLPVCGFYFPKKLCLKKRPTLSYKASTLSSTQVGKGSINMP